MRNEDVEDAIREWTQEAVLACIKDLVRLSKDEGFAEGIIARFREGREKFGGNFDPASEDWIEHGRQELQDAVVYKVFKWLDEEAMYAGTRYERIPSAASLGSRD